MSEEIKKDRPSAEVIAAHPEVQEFADMVTDKLATDSFAAWQAKQEQVNEVPETPSETPEPAPMPKPAPAPAKPLKQTPKFAEPVAVSIEDIENFIPQAAGPAVVSNNTVDYVRLSAIVFKNIHARKSLSVHHLQRRLNELGYTEAFADKDGYYGDKTREAVGRFQGDNNLPGGGLVDQGTIDLLFRGDPNVLLID
jgi:hypothetical protein